MRLICPNCVAQYEVDEDVIPAEGRDVQCANCGHMWFQDTVQMLSTDTDMSTGVGDPDSDVPAALFNDLEGKLDTAFVSTRAASAPNPIDTEPEEPRDDFQIESKPSTPSSRLAASSLDVLRTEAEYSSGEKPPAAQDDQPDLAKEQPKTETPDKLDLSDLDLDAEIAASKNDKKAKSDKSDDARKQAPEKTSDPVEDPTPIKDVADDGLDEIRKRIQEMEDSAEDAASQEPEPAVSLRKTPEPIDIPDLEDIGQTDNETANTLASDNPFTRPSSNGSRSRSASVDTDVPEPSYEANIPVEETGPITNVDSAIEALIAETAAEEDAPRDRKARKVAARAFPVGDDLYGASNGETESRKDLFPDVEDVSTDIASDADADVIDSTAETAPIKAKPKKTTGFLRGFTWAILLCLIVVAIYLFKPQIIEFVPQAENALNMVTNAVDTFIVTVRGLLDQFI